MGALARTLRYLGLSGGDAESLTADLAAHRDARGGPAAVGTGLSFRGEVAGDGDFHIAGRFEGDINVTGRVLVGEGADVDANINARAIVVGGTVRGNLSAATRVEILPTGVLTGTLKTGSFSAADGAAVKGEIWVERPGAADHAPERRA
ncbi:MAG TPA: polymer-forming cytoskeletal protein [Candidatus Deferrimicrobiaceae bacterium]|nr:polymer-forming cytoskeletal protein [Candidatus Deferrimicrobiaceae bacterium]